MDTLLAFVAAALGSISVTGIALKVGQRWLQKTISDAEEKKKLRLEEEHKQFILEQQQWRSLGRTLFWIVNGLEKYQRDHSDAVYFNGELQEAHQKFKDVEEQIKELQQKQLARLKERK